MATPVTFSSLIKKRVEAKWTAAEFRAMERKDLRKFATWNGEATILPAKYAEALKVKGFTTADHEIAMMVYTSPVTKAASYSRPDAFVATTGGNMVYTDETVEYVKLSGEKMVRSNSPIPAPFGEVDAYDNLVAVSAFVAHLVQVDSGQWVSTVNSTNYLAVDVQGVSIPGLVTVASMSVEILSADTVWFSLPILQRNAITGPEALCFIRGALSRVSVEVYDLLNTMIVCKCFTTFQMRGKRWIVVQDENGAKAVPDTVYKRVKPSNPAILAELKKDHPGCYWYYGGWIPKVAFPESLGTIETAQKNCQVARSIQGSDTSATSLLAHMRGFSGLTDAFGKRVQFLLGATLFAASTGNKVDIKLTTVGDIHILVSSLERWTRYLEKTESDLFSFQRSDGVTDKRSLDVCMILPNQADKASVHSQFHHMLRDIPRSDAVLVYYRESAVPTSGEKGKTPDYDKLSELVVPSLGSKPKGFIIYGAIYGIVPFKGDPEAMRKFKNSMKTLEFPEQDVFVHAFGNSANFRGVVSTFPEMALVGFGFPKKQDGWDKREMKLVVEPLKLIKSQKDWYHLVAIDARLAAFAFMRPVTRYSSISNLPYMSKKGVTMQLNTVPAEDGTLIGNVIRTAAAKKESAYIYVQDEDDNDIIDDEFIVDEPEEGEVEDDVSKARESSSTRTKKKKESVDAKKELPPIFVEDEEEDDDDSSEADQAVDLNEVAD